MDPYERKPNLKKNRVLNVRHSCVCAHILIFNPHVDLKRLAAASCLVCLDLNGPLSSLVDILIKKCPQQEETWC